MAHIETMVKMIKVISLLVFLVALSTLCACSNVQTLKTASIQTAPQVLPRPETSPSPVSTSKSPIHFIDFDNFSYPEIESRRIIKLINRREPIEDDPYFLVDVAYGDVTDDGNGEAFVVLTQSTRGTAIPMFAYIYTMRQNKPKLLWSFYAGERGDGGLRRVFSENGELIVELYGSNRVVNRESKNLDDQMGVCCPQFFTRSRYKWSGKRFVMRGQEVVQNPQSNAAYLPIGK